MKLIPGPRDTGDIFKVMVQRSRSSNVIRKCSFPVDA